MNNLSELRDMFLANKVKIKEFSGWYLKVGRDIYTMCDSTIFKNSTKMTNNDIKALFKKRKKNI